MTSGILSPMHLLIVLVVALIVLGPKRLPGAGRALGQGLREFKDSIGGTGSDDEPAQIPAAAAAVAMTPEPAAKSHAGAPVSARELA
ncbi:MAG: twin-arginine translocase TatA/TatE family subunit [Actinomycetota bacterium]|nr:twin-arginine translocase TatA/TatE family subunit [Actinomycetota bacterium]